MPRYFFDVHNGNGASRDEHGLELSSADRVMSEISRIMLDIARDEFPSQEEGRIAIFARDERGNEICASYLSFQTEWLKQDDDHS
ncbi:DUF6894 family protein [Neorhizobium sp. NPDC001467]|uniref:DUF6894 family protein n=1 Tax=Neorhizobium sp. NPDC001467 TaxID=3390595 RepID=UPI003D048D40